MKKINITINDELLQKIDEFAKSKYMTRSAFLALAADTYMNQSNVLENLPVLVKLFEEQEKAKENNG